MIDPQLAYDATQMNDLLAHPAWPVLVRHVNDTIAQAKTALLDHRRSMEEIRFSQGAVFTAEGLLGLPARVIAEERNQRR